MFMENDYRDLKVAIIITIVLLALSAIGALVLGILYAIIFHWACVFLTLVWWLVECVVALFAKIYFSHVWNTTKMLDKLTEYHSEIKLMSERLRENIKLNNVNDK